MAGLVYLAYLTTTTILNGPAYDARAYYDAHLASLYARPDAATHNAYYYSPAFAQILAPLTALPWPVFIAIWMTIAAATLAYMSGPLLLLVLLFPPVVIELQVGNIHFLLGLAVALGIEYPAVWAFPLLTKVTPGIGILWFAVRREWRGLRVAREPRPRSSPSRSPLRQRYGSAGWNPRTPAPITSGRCFPRSGSLVVRLVLAAALIAWARVRIVAGRCQSGQPWRCPCCGRPTGRCWSACCRLSGRGWRGASDPDESPTVTR